MDAHTADLYTKCDHYSVRYPKGIETWYLYLQYETGGSLSGLLRNHQVNVLEREQVRLFDPDFREHLPEIFLWIVFERLVRACERLRRDPRVRDKQLGFIHHDIKAANMLLKENTEENRRAVESMRRNKRRLEGTSEHNEDDDGERDSLIPEERRGKKRNAPTAYPTPILADFEYCYRLGQDQIWWKVATKRHTAPGKSRVISIYPLSPLSAPSKQYGPYPASPVRTDIFQIGCVMYSLMRNNPPRPQRSERQPRTPRPPPPPSLIQIRRQNINAIARHPLTRPRRLSRSLLVQLASPRRRVS
ncbi:hypothetical protein BU23DRAFT_127484 [Bimuria novae-zelandiae CBS 107.79]|uniref:Protein kinase domain-containing protein n=1 Tax=Bimuria novae-zelandiae CBS 107.79 TaxID=1447943 RepID=A0A6A5VF13_9PLEO|nr:hypothetical protein BU23DRAFT_127484 [Bimuria novae-zelandiae CBS 107.79]